MCLTSICPGATTAQRVGQSVFVDESVEAGQALGRLDELTTAGRWVDAARLCDRIIAYHADRLVHTEGSQYVNVAGQVHDRLARWPREAVAIYRELFDGPAAAALAALDEGARPEELLAVANRWFLTEAGGRAAHRAAQRLAEQGRISAAKPLFERLSQFHPGFGADAAAALEQISQAAGPLDSVGQAQPVSPARVSGELLWHCDPRPGGAGAVLPLSAPVVAGEHVYLQSAAQVWSLRLNSGYVDWSCGSRALDSPTPDPPEPAVALTCLPPSLANDWLFAVLAAHRPEPPGPGAWQSAASLVCLDARRGAQRWRIAAGAITSTGGDPAEAGAVFDSAPLVHEGALYVVVRHRAAPTLMVWRLACLDTGSGRLQWQTQLLGASCPAAGLLADAGSTLEARGGVIQVDTGAGAFASVDSVMGRIGRLAVYEPGIRNARAGDRSGTWRYAVSIGDLVVAVGDGGVSAHVPQGSSWDLLAGLIASRPDDASARLDLAWHAMGKPSLIKRGLHEVDAALGWAAVTQPGDDIGHRAFETILKAASTLTAAGADETPGPDLVALLVERAKATAAVPAEHVRWRLAFADVYVRLERPAEAVDLWQQVLDEHPLRQVAWMDGDRRLRAGDVATRRIDEAVARWGRSCYATQDAEAQARFTAARANLDGDALSEALARFANAQAAPEATVALAEIERRAGQPLAAVRRLRTVLAGVGTERASAGVPAAAVMRLIADCCFDAGWIGEGLAWLARGRRDYPDARLEVGESVDTFESLRQRRLVQRLGRTRAPALRVPLKRSWQSALEGPAVVLGPRREPHAAGMEGLVLVYCDGRVVALDAATGQPRWPEAPGFVTPPTWLALMEDVLVLATRYQVHAIDPATGTARWVFGSAPAAVRSAAVDPEVFVELREHALDETHLVTLDQESRVWGVRVGDGRILWHRQLDDRCAGPLVLNDEYAVCTANTGGGDALVVLDVRTGNDVRRLVVDGARRVRWMAMSPERTILASGADWIACFSPDTGERLWQHRLGRLAMPQPGLDGVCFSPAPGEVAMLSLSGDELWRIRMPTSEGEVILRIWLDRNDVYVVTARAVSAYEQPTGRQRWRAELPAGTVVDCAMLAVRSVAVITSPPMTDLVRDAVRRVELHCIDREGGRSLAPVDLQPDGLVRHAMLLNNALVIHEQSRLVAWTPANGG